MRGARRRKIARLPCEEQEQEEEWYFLHLYICDKGRGGGGEEKREGRGGDVERKKRELNSLSRDWEGLHSRRIAISAVLCVQENLPVAGTPSYSTVHCKQ